MLNVSYLRTYGYVKVKSMNGKYYRCLIHPANCLYATIWHNKQNKTANLVDFFDNENHLERCLKDKLFEDNYKEIVIYTNTDWKEKYKVAKLWAKYGFKVTLKVAKKWRKNEKKKTVLK